MPDVGVGVPAVFGKDCFPYRLPRLGQFTAKLNILVLPFQRDQIAKSKGKGPCQVRIVDKVTEFPAVAIAAIFTIKLKMTVGVHPSEKPGAHLVSFGYIRIDDRRTAFAPIKNRQVVRSEEHTSELQSRENLV